jgi:UDPglucose--hexose-1-phosphate uridylyltransferase
VHRRALTKPDGRALTLYSRRPILGAFRLFNIANDDALPNPRLRWHPLRGEWVAYATHRQLRTFFPPPHYNPLAPGNDASAPTELPVGDYDVAVFDNRFPTFSALAVAEAGENVVAQPPATGACEVVVFAQDPQASLGTLPLSQLELIFEVWGERYRELGARDDVRYVLPFENRGVEVGVTLTHPHGQIYAYPFVPPIPARELAMQRDWLRQHGIGLVEAMLAEELRDGRRVLYGDEHALAFVPACARYPYEVWVAPRRAMPSFAAATADERAALARALKTVLLKYDALWSRPMPYAMVLRQAPTDGALYPEAHAHIELYPPLRMHDRLKYVAGAELGSGVFGNDTLPEDTAAALRACAITLE